jgi:hypothetical protein
MAVFWDASRATSETLTDVSQVITASSIRAMTEEVNTSEKSVSLYEPTLRNFPKTLILIVVWVVHRQVFWQYTNISERNADTIFRTEINVQLKYCTG